MSMSKSDLLNAARLGSLELTEAEQVSYLEQLDQILSFADKIKEVETAGVPETNQGLDLVNVFRDDVVIKSLTNDEALANAPETFDGQFKVPTIIE